MLGFREAVNVTGLCDLGFIGDPWTFEKNVCGGTYTRVRLNRVLASSSWWTKFPFASVKHLTFAKSNHLPLLLRRTLPDAHQAEQRARSFKYKLMWETHESFFPFMDSVWKRTEKRNSMHDLKVKLHSLSGEMSTWNNEVFGR
jgi:hypothetical protein